MSEERLTYRNRIGGEAYLKYGLAAKWEKMPRYDILNNAIQKLAEYEDLEERLEKMFGGKLPLSKYIDELEFALKEQGNPHPMNARILTYAESAKWKIILS